MLLKNVQGNWVWSLFAYDEFIQRGNRSTIWQQSRERTGMYSKRLSFQACSTNYIEINYINKGSVISLSKQLKIAVQVSPTDLALIIRITT